MVIVSNLLKFLTTAFTGLVLSLAWLTLINPASTLWAATSSTLPLHFFRSADCTGEVVEISGELHFVNQTQPDGSVVGHFNYQGVRGVGLTSGTIYQTTAVDQFRLSAPFPSSISSVRTFQLISRGGSSNLLVTIWYIITVNADGETTVSINELNTRCT